MALDSREFKAPRRFIRTKSEIVAFASGEASAAKPVGESPDLPDGMTYAEEIITPAEENRLTHYVAALPLKPFEFVAGLKGNRRVIFFGFRYD
jgi:hypothetical protein